MEKYFEIVGKMVIEYTMMIEQLNKRVAELEQQLKAARAEAAAPTSPEN